ncbi:murinoglobulin-1-like [Mastomys coucha]|uniref:murinoglobulin-1-like n=1 Tax=Mastomys coucha TaxID=35658 RepID=UPI001262386A|nr:murinoglobulin-1-like [Mastomys coucha]
MWKNRQVQLCLFSVLLALLTSASSVNGDSKYMVLVPSQLYTDTPEKICLHLYHLNETVTVTASLISQWGRRKLFDELVVDKDLFQCVSFIIHRFSSSDEEEFLYVDIKGPTHTFSKRNAVLVKNKESVVFVQTDKPVYKPGQSVLPRFDVDLKVPNAISVHDDTLSVDICAKYTYGKPVPGHVKISICHETGTGCKEVKSQLDNNGCSTQEVNITELQSKKRDHRIQLFHVNATVTEEGTGLEFSGSGTTKIERTSNKLIFLKADSHFRHGIPFFVKVLLLDIKGAPIPNEQVFIKAEETSYTNGTTTDQHGVAKFSIDTANISGYSLHIKVNFEVEKCLRNKVDLSFSSSQSLPASQTTLRVTASPQSLCGLRAVDQSVLLLKPEAELSPSWIYNLPSMQHNNFIPSSQGSEDQEDCILYRSWVTDEHTYSVPYGKEKDVYRYVEPLILGHFRYAQNRDDHLPVCFAYSDAEVSEKLSLVLPPTVVNDSARAHFSVMGDILSSAIKNTQNLLHMPYGCGEQNMVLFAPNIYVLKYLNETQQLTQKIKSKALGFLRAGYQRELNYKHKDGSYSAFGDKYDESQGNTWLTAFVLKSFAQARAFIFIDESHITHAFTWLSQQQKDNGCFRSSGSLFNNAMKGGVDDEVTLSAYITMALLESSFPATHPVVSKALSCLESSWKTIEQGGNGSFVYTKALMAYAFALAGNQDRRNEILKSLDEEAIKEDNSIHWERPQKPRKSEHHLYKPQASSAEVEMNAYVVLARLTAQPAPTPEDLTLSRSTIKWLTKQQNSNGGFSSTQDTVVALDALSKYGAITFSRSQKSPLVTIQSSGSFSQKFQVENSNRLLLQQVQLPDIPGEYTISMSGEGCVYAQTTLRYNIHLEKQQSAFALRVQTVPLTCDNPNGHNSFQISLEIRYTGTRSASNMVIVDVKMVSGFIPLKPTVKKLERLEHISRTEVSNNNVLLYLDQVTNHTLAFSFITQQDIPVRNLQPAIVKVYDYYETDEVAFAEYSSPCSSDEQNV